MVEETGQEHDCQERLHAQRGRDDCLEQRGNLAHRSRPGLLGGEHALGESQVSGHREGEDDASVMTPRPPTTMPAAMTACPKGDQYDAVSTVVRPVTHTADTAVKSTSTKGAGSSEAEAWAT